MPIEFTDYIRRLLPLALHELPAKPDLRSIGWGQTSDSNSSLSEDLQVVRVASVTNNESKIVYGNQITDKMGCVVGNYNEGACHGGIGSPLLDAYSRYTAIHVGFASFVSSNGCESTDPSGYTRIYGYVNWITEVTR
ncbi:hypothetical protein Zmor_015435 [Zophobas morio]|uniref:Peptidase S1 domain-containing protein n=1 Tax=Zophobas morio TaxID=2755281 RepID=A0AA38ILH1_9CUCU|nr:hypothetical protein Zmor_015435 [Zophobas morio]